MIRVVRDTNVLVSAIAGFELEHSTPEEILRRWEAGSFALIVSEAIFNELRRTLTNPYFDRLVAPGIRERVLTALRSITVTPVTTIVERVATHSEDDFILATAVSGEADYLVTGDRALQRLGRYAGIEIVSPREFLEILDRSEDL